MNAIIISKGSADTSHMLSRAAVSALVEAAASELEARHGEDATEAQAAALVDEMLSYFAWYDALGGFEPGADHAVLWQRFGAV